MVEVRSRDRLWEEAARCMSDVMSLYKISILLRHSLGLVVAGRSRRRILVAERVVVEVDNLGILVVAYDCQHAWVFD